MVPVKRPVRFLWLTFGVFLGAGATVTGILFFLISLPGWLVMDNIPGKADAAVVLGGGGGSRLRKAMEFYDQGLVPELILVGEEEKDWLYLAKHLCRDCRLDGKQVTLLTGSEDTVTDAELSLAHCRERGFKKIIVITDPYHSRRAKVIFDETFLATDIDVTIINSADYGDLSPPHAAWWDDERSLEIMWREFGKIIYFKLAPFLSWALP